MAYTRKKQIIKLQAGEDIPDTLTVDGVEMQLCGVSRGVRVTHYIYQSRRSGWRVAYTDREFRAGIPTKQSNKKREVWFTPSHDDGGEKNAPKNPAAPAWSWAAAKKAKEA